ncbi:MAG: hypothetical protein JST36_04165 [Bacteroidetes bacterium]|nr:hypothetical protein [Bacteroidota bacterium]
MNLFKSSLFLVLLVLVFASCARRRGYDRPIERQRQPGWHRGQGYGHGPGTYTPSRYHKTYRHYPR